MSDPRSCPQCGAVLPSDAPDGLCPKCLLQLGFDSQAARAAEDARSATVYRPRFLPPSITELAAHFPQLEVLEQIGHGGMGVVYKARQRDLDRVVALKILRPDIESDPAFAERFVREARALAKLSHPAIVTVHDFGRKDSLYYFVMEYIDGTNLRDLERSGRLTPQQALVIVPRICEALQYAHDQGVVHRDIKPENILIDKGGRVKIADFGLAKVLGTAPDAGTLTGAWQVMGTPHYMAPEQMQGAHQVDHRADIYSLGVVIYEMLTGELPVGRFPLPSQKVQVDVRLDDVVLRTLEREPARRYQHASDVKTDVESISSVSQPKPLPVPAGSPSADRGGGALPGGSPDRSAAAREIVQGPADAMMLAGGAALLTAIGVAIWLWLKWNDVVLQPNTRFGLTLMSVTHTVYGLFMIANGWLMRRLRLRVVVLLCAVLVGLFVPAVLALNVIMELPRIPEWPVGIPIWLGMPVACGR
jgi:serine/threonine protein kinase